MSLASERCVAKLRKPEPLHGSVAVSGSWPQSKLRVVKCNKLSILRFGKGWHADDESLFMGGWLGATQGRCWSVLLCVDWVSGRDRDCPIVSVSLGARRESWPEIMSFSRKNSQHRM